MKHRDDEKQEPAKQKTQSSILGRILGRAKEEAEPDLRKACHAAGTSADG